MSTKQRKQLIEELAANFHAIKNKMHAKTARAKKGKATYSQQFALFIISHANGAGIKEISTMLCTTSSAATQLVNELVRQGFVTRKTNTKDRRALDLTISKKGEKQILEAKKMQLKMMSSLFLALSDKELKQFIKLHQKILNNL